MSSKAFRFKRFSIEQDRCAMKIGTDGVLLGAWVRVEQARKALDIGTGTGVIAIMLAQRAPQLMVDAVDIDPAAASQAAENMARSPWCGRLRTREISIQEYAAGCGEKYDLIVSNPPFFSGGTLSKDQSRNQIRHTVKLPNGDLLAAARNLLLPQGKFAVILPYMEGHRFVEMAQHYHLYCQRFTEVRPKKGKAVERLLLEFGREKTEPAENSLVIHQSGDDTFSGDYINLTREFYRHMPD